MIHKLSQRLFGAGGRKEVHALQEEVVGEGKNHTSVSADRSWKKKKHDQWSRKSKLAGRSRRGQAFEKKGSGSWASDRKVAILTV